MKEKREKQVKWKREREVMMMRNITLSWMDDEYVCLFVLERERQIYSISRTHLSALHCSTVLAVDGSGF